MTTVIGTVSVGLACVAGLVVGFVIGVLVATCWIYRNDLRAGR